MVSLIEHAHDAIVPAPTAWLISGSVAVGLLALVITSQTLDDARRLPGVYRPLAVALVVGAAAALLIPLLQPIPWVFAALLGVILSVLWFIVVGRFLSAGAWTEAEPDAGREAPDAVL
jgi:membrane associated rhomboid family serine protease